MRIKHAYNTLLNSSSRKKYDSGSRGYNSSQRSQSRNTQAEEESYVNIILLLQETSLRIFKKNSGIGKPVQLHKESQRAYGRNCRK
ncbi:unnamed protein product [Trifolium pratense]|uniref:Uncharacterized protein n=1 Tax=Trifolium pratense TaxID=57577 RepID=A0ACB0KYE2_TRIPR|nr:unnamed protein product [Trifolium pratense]